MKGFVFSADQFGNHQRVVESSMPLVVTRRTEEEDENTWEKTAVEPVFKFKLGIGFSVAFRLSWALNGST